jgi:hypothetical protein
MTPEHADLEADWLADELRRAQALVEGAVNTNDIKDKDLYLAGLEQLLGSLYNHYRIDSVPADGQTVEAQYRPLPRSKERGALGSFFLGEKK